MLIFFKVISAYRRVNTVYSKNFSNKIIHVSLVYTKLADFIFIFKSEQLNDLKQLDSKVKLQIGFECSIEQIIRFIIVSNIKVIYY